MAKNRSSIRFTAVLLLAAIAAAGCGSSSLKIGWQEHSSRSQKHASYRTLNGTEIQSICLKDSETLQLSYRLEVSQGSLRLTIQDPSDQAIWDESFTDDSAGSFQPASSPAGCYRLLISGEQTSGSFDLSW